MQLLKITGILLLTLAGIVIIRDGLVLFATTGLSPFNAGESALGFLLLCSALFLCLREDHTLHIGFKIGIVAVIGGWFLLLGGYGFLKNPGILELFFILAGILVLAVAGRQVYRAIRPPAAGE